ncbi:MAG: SDR family NAD(P)-dependent oxidoreductase [Chitinophagaceae bacterium]|nr:SDR family NAD(P)-dependent oxidoreductase [Chitinophagaceae bacterium]
MKNVLVSGASGQLGQAVINHFLNEENQVAGIAGSNKALPFSAHPRYLHYQADLRNETAAAEVLTKLTGQWQRIDVAVLTAGGYAGGKLAGTGSASIHEQLQLNFDTAYNLARPLWLQMMTQGYGRLFLIGSRPGLNIEQAHGSLAYGLSKSLLFRLAELLNHDAGTANVVTSVVVPSTIDTPPNRQAMPDADFTKWVKPEAIAALIAYHCSEAADALRAPIIKAYNAA